MVACGLVCRHRAPLAGFSILEYAGDTTKRKIIALGHIRSFEGRYRQGAELLKFLLRRSGIFADKKHLTL